MMTYEQFRSEVLKHFSDNGVGMSQTEKDILKEKFKEGYTPKQTADFLKYDGIDDYIEQMLTESCRYE